MQFANCFKTFSRMRFGPQVMTSMAAVALTCVVTAAAYYYKRRRAEINEVMIFCKLQYNVFNYFDKLLNFIESAEKSIHICMPTIHNPAIQARLIESIKRKNICARIIIDCKGYNDSTASFLEELIDAGALIKWKSSDYKMHHKFCLVDDEVLMTGTLDWGNDLSCDNWNYVYITSKVQLVEPVRNEFYQMWNDIENTSLVPWEYADDGNATNDNRNDSGADITDELESSCDKNVSVNANGDIEIHVGNRTNPNADIEYKKIIDTPDNNNKETKREDQIIGECVNALKIDQ